MYLGNDGGVYRSSSNGDSRTWTHATYEPWVQPYHISVSQQDPSRLVAGLQDQGSIRTWTPGVEPTDLTQWNSYGGGDGFSVQIDPTDQLRYYQCSQPTPPTIRCARRVDAAAVRLDEQHDDELLDAALAVEHARLGGDADGARSGRRQRRVRGGHVDRALG